MYRKKLCPRCKTGKNSYLIDKSSTECPYLDFHDGKRCKMYVKLKRNGSIKEIIKKR